MASINIKITAPASALGNYADDIGYVDQVQTSMDENNNPVFGTNPESKQDFLARRIEEILASSLAQQASRGIRQQKEVEYKTETATLVEQIKGATTVTIT